MKKSLILLVFVLVAVSGCVENGIGEIVSGNCQDCVVSGSFEMPELEYSEVTLRIKMYEFDSMIADVPADLFDEIELVVDEGQSKIYFKIGERLDIKEDRKYYLSSRGYVGDNYVIYGRCSHGDFCEVLDPAVEVEIVGEIKYIETCEVNEDCSDLDCSEEQERIGDSISIGPICRNSECICGCGSSEYGCD